MGFSFLRRSTHFLFWFALFVGFFISWGLFFLIGTVYAITIYLYLCRDKAINDEQLTTQGMIFAPVNGKVISVTKGISHPDLGKDVQEIRLAMNLLPDFGLYLPLSCEVLDVKKSKGTRRFRYWRSRHAAEGPSLILEGQLKGKVGIQFNPCFFGGRFDTMVLPGDRGRRKANFGLFPFGGTVVIYIPSTCEIMTTPGTKIKAAETILASTTEIKKEDYVH